VGFMDRTSMIMKGQLFKYVIYTVIVCKRKNEKVESSFVASFPLKEDTETMQALCFRMAELQNVNP